MRYVIANRLSGQGDRRRSRAAADAAEAILGGNADILRDTRPGSEEARRIFLVDVPADEIAGFAGELDPGLVIEPEWPRRPGLCAAGPVDGLVAAQGPRPPDPGWGASLRCTLRAAGRGISDARALLVLLPVAGGGAGSRMETRSDKDGQVAFDYDPKVFFPYFLAVEPRSCYWSAIHPYPQPDAVIELRLIGKTGPDAWWRQAVGLAGHDPDRGAGIRIGLVDTGVGPHPYLAHVKGMGALVDGDAAMSAEAALDARGHGTHVAGLIGARPVADSGDFAGGAPGAEMAAIRVFSETGGGNQGDIAEAIDILAVDFEADLINLSFGAAEPSAIERDAIAAALEVGCLSVASAGNQNGAPVFFPAAYPETLAVTALGLVGAAPAGSLSAASMPAQAGFYAQGGYFVANFANLGHELSCAAPGVGIISTVPGRPETVAPYAEMSGTSMAAPMATAALASLLSADPHYRDQPRGPARIARAAAVIASRLAWIGLPPAMAGHGVLIGHPSRGTG